MRKYFFTVILFSLYLINCSGGFGIPSEKSEKIAGPGYEDDLDSSIEHRGDDTLEYIEVEKGVSAGNQYELIDFDSTIIPIISDGQNSSDSGSNWTTPIVTTPNPEERESDGVCTINYNNVSFIIYPYIALSSSRSSILEFVSIHHFSYAFRNNGTVDEFALFNINTTLSLLYNLTKVDSVFTIFHANITNSYADEVLDITKEVCNMFYFDVEESGFILADRNSRDISLTRSLFDVNVQYDAVINAKEQNSKVQVAFYATGITENIVNLATDMIQRDIHTKFFVQDISQELFNRINSTLGLSVVTLNNISKNDLASIDWRLFINTIYLYNVEYQINNEQDINFLSKSILNPFSFIENSGGEIVYFPERHTFSAVFEAHNSFDITDFNTEVVIEFFDDNSRTYNLTANWSQLRANEVSTGYFRYSDEKTLLVLIPTFTENVIHQVEQLQNSENINAAVELLEVSVRDIEQIIQNTQLELNNYLDLLNNKLAEFQN